MIDFINTKQETEYFSIINSAIVAHVRKKGTAGIKIYCKGKLLNKQSETF